MLFEIFLCPNGKVFIPSSIIYLLSSKQDKDILLLLEYK